MSKIAKDPSRRSTANRYRMSFAVFICAAVLALIVLAVQRRMDDFWWILNGLLQPKD